MIILKIENSTSKLENLGVQQHRELRKLLSYQDRNNQILIPVRDKTTGQVKKITTYKTFYLLDKHAKFPTGLVYMVQDYLKKNKISYQTIDLRIKPQICSISDLSMDMSITPYVEQEDAAKAVLKHSRGIVVGPTGVGKSVIIALMIEYMKVPTLIVVPSLELKNQLTKSLREFFGSDMVGPLKHGKDRLPISVENVDQLDTKEKLKGIDLLLLDEFHRSGSMTYRTLNENSWGDIYFKVGLTATPFRSRDEEKMLLEGVLSKVIYKIDYSTAVEKGYIVPMDTFYIDLPKIDCSYRTWQTAYKELVVERHDRNVIICDMIENLHKDNISTLVLVKHIQHGQILQDMMLKRDLRIDFANGQDGNNKDLIASFNAQECTILIGTTGVLGEGIDTKPCEYVILAGGGKSKNQFMQNIGRGFRRFKDKQSCKIIMFRDSSNKWLLDHFNSCKKYLKEEYSKIPSKLDM